jgi:hypothetical protein
MSFYCFRRKEGREEGRKERSRIAYTAFRYLKIREKYGIGLKVNYVAVL